MQNDLLQQAYIKRLILKNYKKFEEAEVDFTPGLNILVGQNNAGKTTILEALNILLGERNLSPLSVKRSYFNKFKSGAINLAKLVLEINYPVHCGSNEKEVNFVKQLKVGKGSSQSKLPYGENDAHVTIEEVVSGEADKKKWGFSNNLSKSGFNIKTIFLVTEISVDSNFEPEVTYNIYINIDKPISSINPSESQVCYKVIGISGSQRSSIFNFLFLPANRINNKSLTEINDFNWLGRYLRKYIKKNELNNTLTQYTTNHSYPSEILDGQVQKMLNKLFTENEKISIDLINKDDSDSIVTNAQFYLDDGFNDEVTNKAHGLQSATIISLFAGWCKFQSDGVPQNQKVAKMWNTILAFEEPESHFHYPVKNKLLRVLKEEFLDNGAQVFISTHDSTFTNWNYINTGNLIFPNSMEDKKIKSFSLKSMSEEEEHSKRIIRFNGHSFFTDIILIVEGQEEVCLDLLYQLIIHSSLQEEGIILTRSVGGVRKSGSETADTQPLGGKDQIESNIKFFKSVGIHTICLVDIDILFNDGNTVKKIYKELTGEELTLSKQYACTEPASYLRLKNWWETNKEDDDLKSDLKKLAEAGIFVFPGDFEALFTDEYLENFKNPKVPSDLIKEKFTYETKYQIETDQDHFTTNISEVGKIFLIESIKEIAEYVAKFRLEKNKKPEALILQSQAESQKIESDPEDIPF